MLGEYDGDLTWPIQITAHLQLLNHRGDPGHVVQSLKCSKGPGHRAHSALGYDAANNTEYLIDDCLHFRLYLNLQIGTPKVVLYIVLLYILYKYQKVVSSS